MPKFEEGAHFSIAAYLEQRVFSRFNQVRIILCKLANFVRRPQLLYITHA